MYGYMSKITERNSATRSNIRAPQRSNTSRVYMCDHFFRFQFCTCHTCRANVQVTARCSEIFVSASATRPTRAEPAAGIRSFQVGKFTRLLYSKQKNAFLPGAVWKTNGELSSDQPALLWAWTINWYREFGTRCLSVNSLVAESASIVSWRSSTFSRPYSSMYICDRWQNSVITFNSEKPYSDDYRLTKPCLLIACAVNALEKWRRYFHDVQVYNNFALVDVLGWPVTYDIIFRN